MAKNDSSLKKRDVGLSHFSSRISVSTSTSDDDEDDGGKCGYGSCEPGALQCCNNIKGYLLIHCLLSIVRSCLISGFITVNISSLERRFGFSSSEAAIIGFSNHIGFAVGSLFLTYFASTAHRPRVVAMASFSFGLGALLFSLPHFTTPNYVYSDRTEDFTCSIESPRNCTIVETPSNLRNYIYLFVVAQIIHGLSAIPLATLSLSFITENCSKENSSLYLGIANSAGSVGLIIGYSLGGSIVSLYVDFNTVNASELTISPLDPRWVGAWWLGILATTAAFWILSVFIYSFPREFAGSAALRAQAESEVHNEEGEEDTKEKKTDFAMKGFFPTLLLLLKNPPYMLCTIAICIEGISTAGFGVFLPKLVQNQYQQTASVAAITTGLVSIPGGVIGHIFGGFLIKRFKLKVRGIFKLNIISCAIVSCLTTVMLQNCPNRLVAGITAPYQNAESSTENLLSSCNANCSCQEEYFVPVCGKDDVNYFTACHAGCTNSTIFNNTFLFTDCACINGSNYSQTASRGFCSSDCQFNYSLFLGVFFFAILFGYMNGTPAIVVLFRVVPPHLKTFALGVEVFLARVLAAIPGPSIFGAVIDQSCILWQTKQCSGERGSCWIYDTNRMGAFIFSIYIACQLSAGLLYVLAMLAYKPPVKEDGNVIGKEGDDNQSFSPDYVVDNSDPRNKEKQSREERNQVTTIVSTAF